MPRQSTWHRPPTKKRTARLLGAVVVETSVLHLCNCERRRKKKYGVSADFQVGPVGMGHPRHGGVGRPRRTSQSVDWTRSKHGGNTDERGPADGVLTHDGTRFSFARLSRIRVSSVRSPWPASAANPNSHRQRKTSPSRGSVRFQGRTQAEACPAGLGLSEILG